VIAAALDAVGAIHPSRLRQPAHAGELKR